MIEFMSGKLVVDAEEMNGGQKTNNPIGALDLIRPKRKSHVTGKAFTSWQNSDT